MLTYDTARGAWRLTVAGAGMTEVLTPLRDGRWPLLLLLPVEPAGSFVYGDGLALARELDLANRLSAVIAAPTFDTLPWYGSHATDPHIRHDAQLVDTVLPALAARIHTTACCLQGFSKSGWGAMSLLARYPDHFAAAASWDAPLLMDEPRYGAAEHYGDAGHFAHHRPLACLADNPAPFRAHPRLVITGRCNFGPDGLPPALGDCHTAAAHAALDALGIPHHYDNGLTAPHRWDAAWVVPAAEAVLAQSR
jgi:hypothetical protein